MEGCSKRDPQLLDLIHGNREWVVEKDQQSHGSSEERKLELRLGPPGEDWSMSGRKESLLSLGHLSSMKGNQNQTQKSSPSQNQNPFLQFPSMAKESSSSQSQTCWTKVAEKKALSISSSPLAPPANTAVPKTSHKRTAPAPVVGWPPIRSFRKNLASTSFSKPAPSSCSKPAPNSCLKPVEISRKGMFVKINVDGVPIGRKVDLTAYNSYQKLSTAVDDLFRDLLAAQRDSSVGGMENTPEEEKPIMERSGEYALVYEDNEGDRMLVGDVPWQMFVSTVKRLRVMKTSELAALSLGSKQHKLGLDSA